jgi:hypothetical protein
LGAILSIEKGRVASNMQTMINELEDLPCLVRFTSTANHDHTFLKDLKLEKGSFVVLNKAYYDYARYLQWNAR